MTSIEPLPFPDDADDADTDDVHSVDEFHARIAALEVTVADLTTLVAAMQDAAISHGWASLKKGSEK